MKTKTLYVVFGTGDIQGLANRLGTPEVIYPVAEGLLMQFKYVIDHGLTPAIVYGEGKDTDPYADYALAKGYQVVSVELRNRNK